MSNTLVLNSSNVIGSGNSIFQYTFLGGSYQVKEGSEVSVSQIQIPYSFFNITQAYNNQSFQIGWTVGSTTTLYTVDITAGFYTIDDLNLYLQQYFIDTGMYLVDDSGENVYYMSFYQNTTYYANQVLFYTVPISSTVPNTWTIPSNFLGFPTVATCPTLVILSTNTFTNLIGLTAGTYGGTTSDNDVLSNFTPIGSTVNSLVVRCSICDNAIAFPTDILDSFSIPVGTSFGSNINYTPNFQKWIKVKSGKYNNFTVSFYDQNLTPIVALDNQVLITLLLKS